MLPIELKDGFFLDQKKARLCGEEYSGVYAFAEPYPHIVLDNFLPLAMAEGLLKNFPSSACEEDTNFVGGYFEHNKRQILPGDLSSEGLNYFYFFNSAPFLQFLEGITSIQGLIPDPYFSGGGFHEISNGGKLGVHADFRIHDRLHLNRRINVLVYLNKDWRDEFGGALEIWDRNMTAKFKSISPIFNRCVIFNTDDSSFHGHPDPLNTPDKVTRKSLALYYYTSSKSIYDETPNFNTLFQARTNEEFEELIKVGVEIYQSGNLTQAEGIFKQMLDKKPSLIGALIPMSEIYIKNNRLDEAIQLLEKGVNLEPENPTIQSALGFAYEAQGIFDRSIHHFKKAIEIDPKKTDVIEAIARLEPNQTKRYKFIKWWKRD